MSPFPLKNPTPRPLFVRRLSQSVGAACLSLGIAGATMAASVIDLGVHRIDQSILSDLISKSALRSEPLDLYDSWQLGFQNDPQYKAALSQFAEHQEQKNISRGGLLPYVAAGYSRSRINGWRQQPNWFGQLSRSDLRYDSTTLYAQLQQPLLNYPRYAEYQRGKAIARFGQAQLEVSQQQTSLRLAQSYFAVVLAFEDWQMQRERAEFLQQRADTFVKLLQHNNATLIEVEETQARLATAQAELLRAADTLRTQSRQLQAYIGVQPQHLRQLQREWYYQPLTEDLDTLLHTATQSNQAIHAAKSEADVFEARLDAARSQYFPTVDLALSFSKADSEDLSTLSQRTNTFSVGVNVNIPIFTGGYTTAATSQARFQLQTAQHRYEAAVAQVQSEVQKEYGLYTSGAKRVAAMQKAVESSLLSVDSMLKSFSVGAANNLDVLNAQDQLIQTRYDFFAARLELLLAELRLQAALGNPLRHTIQSMTAQHFQGAIITLPTTLRYWHDNARGWSYYAIQPLQAQNTQTPAPTAVQTLLWDTPAIQGLSAQ